MWFVPFSKREFKIMSAVKLFIAMTVVLFLSFTQCCLAASVDKQLATATATVASGEAPSSALAPAKNVNDNADQLDQVAIMLMCNESFRISMGTWNCIFIVVDRFGIWSTSSELLHFAVISFCIQLNFLPYPIFKFHFITQNSIVSVSLFRLSRRIEYDRCLSGWNRQNTNGNLFCEKFLIAFDNIITKSFIESSAT